MKTPKPPVRRTVLAALSAALYMAATPSWAQTYPAREIRLIVPWNAGGSVDISARIISKLALEHGLNLVVENVPGATGAIGLAKVATAKPDGYTIGIGTTSQLALVAQGLTKTRNEQFSYLNQVSVEQFLLLVPRDGQAQNLNDFMGTMKQNPGKISIGTAGANNVSHILAATTASIAGVGFVHVPYPGGAKVLTDLAGKQIDAGILKPSEAKGQMDAGLIKAVAVYSDARIPSLPDVPTLKENSIDAFSNGPLIQMSYLVAPAGIPASIQERLIEIFRKVIQHPDYRKFAVDNGFAATDVYGATLRKQVDDVQATLNRVAPKLFKKEP